MAQSRVERTICENRENHICPFFQKSSISSLTPLRVMCPPSKVSLPRSSLIMPYLHTALISKFPLNLNCILFKFFPMWIKSEKGRWWHVWDVKNKNIKIHYYMSYHICTYMYTYIYVYMCAYIHHVYLHTHIIYIYTFDYKSWDAVWLLIMWYSR